MLTPKQIFMLGWYEYQKKQATLSMLNPWDKSPIHLVPPTEKEIESILADHEPKPQVKKPPFDVKVLSDVENR